MGVGEAWCFLINGFSFLAILIALGSVHIRQRHRAQALGGVARSGRRFSLQFGFMPIRVLLLELM